MGVHGLWQLIDRCGRPVTLESLENKVLGVDISIWLHQAVRGFRDRQNGGPVHNAHLLTLFNRICKLLFYKIRPVFVFDGGVPILKKQTLASRRKRKELAAHESENATKKLLLNLVRKHAVNTKIKNDGKETSTASNGNATGPKKQSQDTASLYQLPPLPSTHFDRDSSSDEDDSNSWIGGWSEGRPQRLEDIDFDSVDFRSLPTKMQHEILTDMKEARKRSSWAQMDEMPDDSDNFSFFQMGRLLKRRTLQQRLEEVQKEMLAESTHQAMMHYSGNMDKLTGNISARRIASDDRTHYIYVKNEVKGSLIDQSTNELLDKIEEGSSTATHVREENLGKPVVEKKYVKNVHPKRSAVKTKEAEDDASFSSDDSLETLEQIQQIAEKRKREVEETTEEEDGPSFKTLRTFIPEFSNMVKEIQSHEDEASSSSELVSATLSATALLPATASTAEETVVTQVKEMLPNLEGDITRGIIDPCPSKPVNQFAFLGESPSKSSVIRLVSKHISEKTRQESRTRGPKKVDVTSDDSDESFIEVPIIPPSVEDDLFPPEVFERAAASPSRTVEIMDDLVYPDEDSGKEGPSKDDTSMFHNGSEDESDTAVSVPPLSTLSTSELQSLSQDLNEQEKILIEERNKQDRVAASISDQMYSESQELLRLFGIPYVVSPMEAEAQCATLDRLNLTDGTITDDSDVWLFGGRRVYKNMFNQRKHVECYQDTDIQSLIGLNRIQLICIALLTGSDYTDGIEGVGYVTALEILGEFPGESMECLKNFRKWWDKAQEQLKIPEETKIKQKLRKLKVHPGFPNEAVVQAYMEPTVDDSTEKFSWSVPDLDSLRDFAKSKFGWVRQRADEILLPVMKKCNTQTSQSRLDSFFPVALKKAEPPSPSKRLLRALNSVTRPRKPTTPPESPNSKAIKVVKQKKSVSGKSGNKELSSSASTSGSKRRVKSTTTNPIRGKCKNISKNALTMKPGKITKDVVLSECSDSD